MPTVSRDTAPTAATAGAKLERGVPLEVDQQARLRVVWPVTLPRRLGDA
jgi:hypothetical protein